MQNTGKHIFWRYYICSWWRCSFLHLRSTVESQYSITNQKFAPWMTAHSLKGNPNLSQQLFLVMEVFSNRVNWHFWTLKILWCWEIILEFSAHFFSLIDSWPFDLILSKIMGVNSPLLPFTPPHHQNPLSSAIFL